MKSVGVVVADAGAAIVTVERTPKDETWDFVATAIERLPFDLEAVTSRLAEMDEPETQFMLDGEGMGQALWAVLGGPDDRHHWQLYTGRGLERQALVDELLIAVQEGRFHFAPALPEQPAMSRAMVSYRRQVKDDGVIGSELVVALCLAIRPLPVEGWFVYA